MKVANTVQNLLLAVVLVAIVFTGLDGLLRIYDVAGGTPGVDVVRTGGELARFDALETVFVDQGPLATMVLSLVAYALIGGLVLVVFWALRRTVRVWRAGG